MKKKLGIAVVFVVAIVFMLMALCQNPITSCKIEIPENYLEAIEGQEKGVYSKRLPLVPIYTRVDNYSEGKVFYTIYYFPLGSVGVSYIEGDGYNMEKPLTRLQ